MRREDIMMKAMADEFKDRFAERTEGRVRIPTVVEVPIPQVTNEAPDFGPLTEVMQRFVDRELPVPQVRIEPVQVSVAAPSVEVHPHYEFKPQFAEPNVTITVDMTPVAEAIDRQTTVFKEGLERIMERIMERIGNRPRTLKIKKHKDGNYTAEAE